MESRAPLGAGETRAKETGGPPPPCSGVRWFKRALWIYPWISLAILFSALQMIFTESPPPRIQIDPQAQTSVDRKLKELRRAMKTQQPYTLSFDEAEVNALINSNLPSAQGTSAHQRTSAIVAPGSPPLNDPPKGEPQAALKDLRVNLFRDLVRAYAVFNFHGLTTSMLLEGRIRAEEGYVRLEPTRAKIGSLSIPEPVLKQLAPRIVESNEGRKTFPLSPHINSLGIREGRLVLVFR